MSSIEIERLLKGADAEDLALLADIITNNGKGRISLSSDVCERLHSIRMNHPNLLHENVRLIVQEISEFGGNSIANFFRGGKGVEYSEVVVDVASHLKVGSNENLNTQDLEMGILLKILEKSMEEMTEAQKRELFTDLGGGAVAGSGVVTIASIQALIRIGGFASYRMALIVANAIARQVTGKGLHLAANAGLTRAISAFAGPIGWAITILWAAYDLAAPAYRVTVPAVVIIAYIRQKDFSKSLKTCPSCGAPIQGDAKFCAQCGLRLS